MPRIAASAFGGEAEEQMKVAVVPVDPLQQGVRKLEGAERPCAKRFAGLRDGELMQSAHARSCAEAVATTSESTIGAGALSRISRAEFVRSAKTVRAASRAEGRSCRSCRRSAMSKAASRSGIFSVAP